MDKAILRAELQQLVQGRGLCDPDLSSRVRVNLRAALKAPEDASSDDLRARLTTLVNALDAVLDARKPHKQRDNIRLAIRGVLGLDDEVPGGSATERRKCLEEITGYNDRTIRRWEGLALDLLADQLIQSLKEQAEGVTLPDVGVGRHAKGNGGTAVTDGNEVAGTPTNVLTAPDASGHTAKGVKPALTVYRTKSYYIINGRPLHKIIYWAASLMSLVVVAFFAFMGGARFGTKMLFDDWATSATSVDAIPTFGSDAEVAPISGRQSIQWTIVSRPGRDAIYTEFKPGNKLVTLTQFAGSFQIDRSPESSCPDTTIAWSISTGSKVVESGSTLTVAGGKVVASGSLGPSNPTQQLYIPIGGPLDTFTVSARLTGAPCPYMGFIWHDPHIVIENRE